jgi:hypothetical protein
LWFRAIGDGPPAPIRIRLLLKIALRALGLKCIGHIAPGDVPAEKTPAVEPVARLP